MKRNKKQNTALSLKGFGLAIGGFLGLAIALSAVFYILQYILSI